MLGIASEMAQTTTNDYNDLLRSKSYDAKLNYDIATPIYSENDVNNYSHLLNKMNTNATNSNSTGQAQIIVTSFAPEAKSKANTLVAAPQLRPTSHQDGLYYTQEPIVTDKSSEQNKFSRTLSVIWPNGKTNPPLIIFNPKVIRKTCWECKKIGEQYHLSYKFLNGERKLVKSILDGHGFRECHPSTSEFNIVWTGNNLKSYAFRSLQEFQKVNHFPRSSELTRKDRLYKNVQRMQKEKGFKAFNIIPTTFIMPFEIDDFYNTFYREKGIWIVKPVSLSRGRGIFLISHPDQIPLDDNLVVSKYVSNPLLIEGFKFDLRLYVAVTSFDPLVFYLYNEGLTRFATIKYDQNLRNIKNTCMHLTNYSLNKKNEKYVRCTDPDVEDYGNKWSMSALLRFLNAQGKDTFTLMMHIEEIIIKTLLAVESPLASASRMFMPFRGNCFELFGFDILVDEDLKPWVLEVNLSPSLDCDAVLDVKVKSNMLADLFTLTGVHCMNPSSFSNRSRQREQSRNKSEFKLRLRPHSANMMPTANNRPTSSVVKPANPMLDGLSPVEQGILKTVVEENQRANGWVRLFPTSDTWEFYSQYMETRSTSFNLMIHKKLFPRRWQSNTGMRKATQSRAKSLQVLFEMYRQNPYNMPESSGAGLLEAIERYQKYERKLVDVVRPNEETLKRLTSASVSHISNYQPGGMNNMRSNFSMFPNGDAVNPASNGGGVSSKHAAKDDNLSTDVTLNEEDSMNDSDSMNVRTASNGKPPVSYLGGQQRKSASSNVRSSFKMRNSVSAIAINRQSYYENSNSSGGGDSRPSKKYSKGSNENLSSIKNDEQNEHSDHADAKYTLDYVLSRLDNGFYMSRIQVRDAFAMYLIKIQLRLVNEAQNKDESNLQQMDLVLRFIKKAAPNLSQEFKVFVPSKRLPLSEQKRMLAKQLHDFLHIYRKDTEQICVEELGQLENERKKYKNRTFNEVALKNLLYKCTEAELEEIMSGYMKNFQDSSVFLGAAKSVKNSNATNAAAAAASSSSSNGKKPSLAAQKANSSSEQTQKKTSTDSTTKKNNDEESTPTTTTESGATQADGKQASKQATPLTRTKSAAHKAPKHANKNYLSVNDLSKNTRKTSGDELSGLSCDSRSLFSNSSESENESLSGSKSDLRSETQSPVNLTSNSDRLSANGSVQQQQQQQPAPAPAPLPQPTHLQLPPTSSNFSSTAPAAPSGTLAGNNADPYKIHLPQRKATVTNLYRSYNRSTGGLSGAAWDSGRSSAFKANNATSLATTTTTPISLNYSSSARRKTAGGINELALNNAGRSGWNNDFSSNSNRNNAGRPSNHVFNEHINDETVIRSIYLTASQHHTVRAKSGKFRSDHASNKPRAMTAHASNHHDGSHSKAASRSNTNRDEASYKSSGGNVGNGGSKFDVETLVANSSPSSSSREAYQKLRSNRLADSTDLEQSNEEGQQALANGLRNLAQRQHERIYSAKSSLFLASTLNAEAESRTLGEGSNGGGRREVPLDLSAAAKTQSNKLIDQLRSQKEKTSRILQQSKAKHDEILMNQQQQQSSAQVPMKTS